MTGNDPEAAYTEALMFLAASTQKLVRLRQRCAELETQIEVQLTRLSELKAAARVTEDATS